MLNLTCMLEIFLKKRFLYLYLSICVFSMQALSLSFWELNFTPESTKKCYLWLWLSGTDVRTQDLLFNSLFCCSNALFCEEGNQFWAFISQAFFGKKNDFHKLCCVKYYFLNWYLWDVNRFEEKGSPWTPPPTSCIIYHGGSASRKQYWSTYFCFRTMQDSSSQWPQLLVRMESCPTSLGWSWRGSGTTTVFRCGRRNIFDDRTNLIIIGMLLPVPRIPAEWQCGILPECSG